MRAAAWMWVNHFSCTIERLLKSAKTINASSVCLRVWRIAHISGATCAISVSFSRPLIPIDCCDSYNTRHSITDQLMRKILRACARNISTFIVLAYVALDVIPFVMTDLVHFWFLLLLHPRRRQAIVINVFHLVCFVLQARNRSNASTRAATGDSPTHPIGRSTRMCTHRTNPTIVASMAVISRTRTHHRYENTWR